MGLTAKAGVTLVASRQVIAIAFTKADVMRRIGRNFLFSPPMPPLEYLFVAPRANRKCAGLFACVCMAMGALSGVNAAEAKEKPVPESDLCPGIHLIGEINPGLSDTEKRLVCGDP